MARLFKIVGAIALAATAACTTDPTAPGLKSPVLARADVTAASTHNVVVTESDISRQLEDTPHLNNWVFYFRFPTSTGAFVSGPGEPPLGIGSFEMGTPTVADKGTLFNYDHIGTRLTDITAISYATYREPSSSPTSPSYQLPSINIEVDYNGPDAGGYTSLVFEPVYNVDPTSIESGVWQSWNGIPGIWWSTRPINGCPVPQCYMQWSYIIENNPNATILGGFGVNQGSGSGGLAAATDALTIASNGSTWIYNFEPFRSKDDCKKDRKDAKGDDGSSKNKSKCKDEHEGSDRD
jgi:hypothetical protein